MTENKRQRTIAAAMALVKDRIFDDEHACLNDFQKKHLRAKPNKNFQEELNDLADFLQTTNHLKNLSPTIENLRKLETSAYWNGKDDTFWELMKEKDILEEYK